MQVAGQNITKKAHDAIVEAVLKWGDDEGYCDEVERALSEVGFTIPDTTKTVTIEVQVSATGRIGDLTSEWRWNIYHDSDVETDSIKVVSVK